MRTPPDLEIYAPELPAGLRWLNRPALRMRDLHARGVVMVEFWDFARVNSLRTLPYLRTWHERYSEAGLRLVGVHSPGYSFGRDARTVAAAVERLEVPYAVVHDPELAVWRLYGNRGWPARYLFDRHRRLRYVHYGEGDYREAELAIHDLLLELDPELRLPVPMEAIRPEDEPGVLLEPQTADIALPAERERLGLVRDWTDGEDYIEAADAGAGALVSFTAGAAWSVLSGAVSPGVYETDGHVVAESPGLRLHGFQFTPAFPAGAS